MDAPTDRQHAPTLVIDVVLAVYLEGVAVLEVARSSSSPRLIQIKIASSTKAKFTGKITGRPRTTTAIRPRPRSSSNRRHSARSMSAKCSLKLSWLTILDSVGRTPAKSAITGSRWSTPHDRGCDPGTSRVPPGAGRPGVAAANLVIAWGCRGVGLGLSALTILCRGSKVDTKHVKGRSCPSPSQGGGT